MGLTYLLEQTGLFGAGALFGTGGFFDALGTTGTIVICLAGLSPFLVYVAVSWAFRFSRTNVTKGISWFVFLLVLAVNLYGCDRIMERGVMNAFSDRTTSEKVSP